MKIQYAAIITFLNSIQESIKKLEEKPKEPECPYPQELQQTFNNYFHTT